MTASRSCCHPEGLDLLDKWVNKNFMKFNNKVKVLHLGRNNHRHQDIYAGG